jgi:hypothetical protein
MPKIQYKSFNFRNSTLSIIEDANIIIADYQAQGFDLTLRQLYYQFISRDLFPDTWIDDKTGSKNSEKSYDKLGGIINDARLAGLIDWSAISDRTRFLRSDSHWSTPQSIIRSAAYGYNLDKWEGQEYRPEIWIEKDALTGIISGICSELDVPYFSCRGYVSQSEMWATGQRLTGHIENSQVPYIIHLGDHDHDPSGMDMTQDIIKRLEMFTDSYEGSDFFIKRIALNHSQVLQYDPPPNPTKLTDSRANKYIDEFGMECWELDALEPSVIVDLIQEEIFGIRNVDKLDEIVEQEKREKEELNQIRNRYDEVVRYLNVS